MRLEPAVIVDENAPTTYDAHRRVRRTLRELGLRSGPKCVCETTSTGVTDCSSYR
jgi:hypothetical protein